MASAIETGSLFTRWRHAVDFAISMGATDNGLVGRLRAAKGEVALLSAWGQWCLAVSMAIDSYNPLADPPVLINAPGLADLLKRAGGEIQLTSELGRWAQRVTAALATP